MALELPTETAVQRRFRAFCAAVEPMAEFAGLGLEVTAGQDGEVMAQVSAPQFQHVPARTFWVHADADELDGGVCMRALMCYVHDFVCRATVFARVERRLCAIDFDKLTEREFYGLRGLVDELEARVGAFRRALCYDTETASAALRDLRCAEEGLEKELRTVQGRQTLGAQTRKEETV